MDPTEKTSRKEFSDTNLVTDGGIGKRVSDSPTTITVHTTVGEKSRFIDYHELMNFSSLNRFVLAAVYFYIEHHPHDKFVANAVSSKGINLSLGCFDVLALHDKAVSSFQETIDIAVKEYRNGKYTRSSILCKTIEQRIADANVDGAELDYDEFIGRWSPVRGMLIADLIIYNENGELRTHSEIRETQTDSITDDNECTDPQPEECSICGSDLKRDG